jgi:alpha-beta hydrolase superfamily lysophospholipase
MKKFRFLKISKSKKLRYTVNNSNDKLYVVFLHGFMSDIEGGKPQAFKKFTIKKKIGFLAMEYSGHGKSSGKFTSGNITKWTNDTKLTINKIIKKKNFILIGSSMGAWIGLNLFKNFNKQIKGFIGIGSAPEFTQRIMWKKFNKKMKNDIVNKGIIKLKSGQYEYPITYQLIKDGKKNKVLHKKIKTKINVTMIHGNKDESVPVIFSKKVLKIFRGAKKKLIIINNGDHSLSKKPYLKRIIKELNDIIPNVA